MCKLFIMDFYQVKLLKSSDPTDSSHIASSFKKYHINKMLHLITACSANYLPVCIHWLKWIHRWMPNLIAQFHDVQVSVWVWPGMDFSMLNDSPFPINVYVLPSDNLPFARWLDPKQFSWKSYIIATHLFSLNQSESDHVILYCDAGCFITLDPTPLLIQCQQTQHSIFIEDFNQINETWTHTDCIHALSITDDELALHQLLAGIQIHPNTQHSRNLIAEWKKWCDMNTVCHGYHQYPYRKNCKGHRHDQSILSVLVRRSPFMENTTLVPGTQFFEWRLRSQLQGIPPKMFSKTCSILG